MEDPPYEPQALHLARPYSPTQEPSETALTAISQDLVHYDAPHHGHGDMQFLGQDCGYHSSASSAQHSSSDIFGGDDEDEPRDGSHSRASSHSSISSIPGSVLTHTMDGFKAFAMRETAANAAPPAAAAARAWDDRDGKAYSRILHTVRQREAAFRKPSSVRAMQMHTEDEGDDDDDFLTPPKRKAAGHRLSDISARSAASSSSPLKRASPYYSPTGSGAAKPKPKKEYPLVLLHCNLLPPSLPVPGLVGCPDQKILQEVLPPEYWRRWKRLEEKVGSGVVRDRGVLISHPEDMYDVLEERLLESLELQRPRLDHGHFLGHDADSEKEGHSTTDDEEGEECPDCGGRVVHHVGAGRKWEIRVFAANGLMKAGAWAAAWKEMEKVDVEVGLWLPSEVRRELEKRLLEDEGPRNRSAMPVPQLHEPVCALPPSLDNPRTREPTPIPAQRSSSSASGAAMRQEQQGTDRFFESRKHAAEIDLQTLLVNYIRVLAADKRNVAIVVLSIMVMFFAINVRPRAPAPELRLFPQDMMDVGELPVMSVSRPLSVVAPSPAVPTGLNLDESVSSVAFPSSLVRDYAEDPVTSPNPAVSTSINIDAPGPTVVLSSATAQEHIADPVATTAESTMESPASVGEPSESTLLETPASVEEPMESVATFVELPVEEQTLAEPEREDSSTASAIDADPSVETEAVDPPDVIEIGEPTVDLEHDALTKGQQLIPVDD
ncbi:flavo protein oxygenase [Aspergillus terreus]|uniref:Flavo protein oxygenase n=1 Tax=Aspergillus terreus TaxID=33178 RepID=A0A5M3Z0V2_ASPTE|nr:hypothetical protein ATETN484_0007032100 [Aspergillus terreus]GFF16126.1 flavo protein oxygenase [Aspergillus terreus]